MDAYLDIETTGLNPWHDRITVVGIFRPFTDERPVQLVGSDITRTSIEGLLEGVLRLYTYNGVRFDAVFLSTQLEMVWPQDLVHRDLMYECWKRNLYGGLKSVERQLGIAREVQGVSGRMAVELWWRYVRYGDTNALRRLLDYNREDVLNLRRVREELGID